MTIEQTVKSVEAIVFASGEGIAPRRIMDVLGIDEKMLGYVLSVLADKYDGETSGVVLVHNTETVSFVTSPDVADDVRKALTVKKTTPLSNAAMETLAIIAYNQPVSKAFIEQVRGVDSSYTVGVLNERGLIEECGRLEVPGRPVLFKTTDVFLRTMGISSLDELPELPDMTDSDGMEKLQEKINELQNKPNIDQMTLSEVTEGAAEE